MGRNINDFLDWHAWEWEIFIKLLNTRFIKGDSMESNQKHKFSNFIFHLKEKYPFMHYTLEVQNI